MSVAPPTTGPMPTHRVCAQVWREGCCAARGGSGQTMAAESVSTPQIMSFAVGRRRFAGSMDRLLADGRCRVAVDWQAHRGSHGLRQCFPQPSKLSDRPRAVEITTSAVAACSAPNDNRPRALGAVATRDALPNRIAPAPS